MVRARRNTGRAFICAPHSYLLLPRAHSLVLVATPSPKRANQNPSPCVHAWLLNPHTRSWSEFEAFLTQEFAAGKALLSGE